MEIYRPPREQGPLHQAHGNRIRGAGRLTELSDENMQQTGAVDDEEGSGAEPLDHGPDRELKQNSPRDDLLTSLQEANQQERKADELRAALENETATSVLLFHSLEGKDDETGREADDAILRRDAYTSFNR